MNLRVAINGFGRIGRTFFRAAQKSDLEIVAINDLTTPDTLAHLLKYDSSYGVLNENISANENEIIINDKKIKCTQITEPENLPWKDLQIDLVIESTGVFRKSSDVKKHLHAGAQRVIVTAPLKDKSEIKTIVPGVNEDIITPNDKIFSMASCTTNCLAPILKILDEALGVKYAFMTTIHSYTMDQNLQDSPHKDLRRARAAANSIIPTTTGATTAVELVLPKLKGKLKGLAFRVPTITVSVVDVVVEFEQQTNPKLINAAFSEASKERKYYEAISVSNKPLVSVDFRFNPNAAIIDTEFTQMIDDNKAKVIAWYDNEMGYSHRLVALSEYLSKRNFSS